MNRFRLELKVSLSSFFTSFVNVYNRHLKFSNNFSPSDESPLRRHGVLLESKQMKMDVLAGRPVPELDHSNSIVIGSPISR